MMKMAGTNLRGTRGISSASDGAITGARATTGCGLRLMAWTTTASGMDCGLPTSAPMRQSGPGP